MSFRPLDGNRDLRLLGLYTTGVPPTLLIPVPTCLGFGSRLKSQSIMDFTYVTQEEIYSTPICVSATICHSLIVIHPWHFPILQKKKALVVTCHENGEFFDRARIPFRSCVALLAQSEHFMSSPWEFFLMGSVQCL